jgi:CRP-like cAMP-binding protein
MYHGAAKSICFFQDKDPSFAAYLMPFLKPHQINNEETIYSEGQYADEMFFILKGRVNLVYGKVNMVYKSYLKGSYFGEIEIIENIGRIDTVLTFGGCELLVLAKEVLENVLEEHPKEGEELKRVAAERKKRHTGAKLKLKELLSNHILKQSKMSMLKSILK